MQGGELCYNCFPNCGSNTTHAGHFSNTRVILALQVRKIAWSEKEKMELGPDGLGLNHCFTSAVVTLRKSITL